MRDLAPDDKKGYAPAHYWRARQILNFAPSPRTYAFAEVHLLKALDGELDDRTAVHGLLGGIYLNEGRLEDAEFHMSKAATVNPAFKLTLALVFKARGNLIRARQEAELAVRYFRDRSRADPTKVADRLAWADAATFMEDFQTAIGVLEEGLTQANPSIFH